MMSDDLITLRDSELKAKLADAWDDGFTEGAAAANGEEYSRNPHSTPRCPVPNCVMYAVAGGVLCASHSKTLGMLRQLAEGGA